MKNKCLLLAGVAGMLLAHHDAQASEVFNRKKALMITAGIICILASYKIATTLYAESATTITSDTATLTTNTIEPLMYCPEDHCYSYGGNFYPHIRFPMPPPLSSSEREAWRQSLRELEAIRSSLKK